MTSGAISVLRSGAPGIAFERVLQEGEPFQQVAEQGEERRADHHAGAAAQPADDGHDHEDQREVEAPRLGRHERVVEREQRTAQPGERAREHEGEEREHADVHAERLRDPRVLTQRQQRAPDFVFIMRQSIQRTIARNARQR